jgi:hypothetical protein
MTNLSVSSTLEQGTFLTQTINITADQPAVVVSAECQARVCCLSAVG